MAKISNDRLFRLTAITMALVMAGAVMADKPGWDAGDPHGKIQQPMRHKERGRHGYQYKQHTHHDDDRQHYKGGRYFNDQDRTILGHYYANEYHSGRCPPGLARKGSSCQPPGQVKKWRVGQPLPHDVVYYEVPPYVMAGIGLPPPGYRFVRVASDILLIAIGTGIVMDAIYDLGL